MTEGITVNSGKIARIPSSLSCLQEADLTHVFTQRQSVFPQFSFVTQDHVVEMLHHVNNIFCMDQGRTKLRAPRLNGHVKQRENSSITTLKFMPRDPLPPYYMQGCPKTSKERFFWRGRQPRAQIKVILHRILKLPICVHQTEKER
jgi:hypothetical protein